jgi:hypothetical protein
LVPPHYARAMGMYQAAFREQLAMPLRPINLDDLRWYFHARLAHRKGSEGRFNQAARAFGATRFGALYCAWLERGDPVLDATLSPVLADKIERQAGQLECDVLPISICTCRPWLARPDSAQLRTKGATDSSGGRVHRRLVPRTCAHGPLDTRRATLVHTMRSSDRKELRGMPPTRAQPWSRPAAARARDFGATRNRPAGFGRPSTSCCASELSAARAIETDRRRESSRKAGWHHAPRQGPRCRSRHRNPGAMRPALPTSAAVEASPR